MVMSSDGRGKIIEDYEDMGWMRGIYSDGQRNRGN